jgi:hypothetical protein
MKKTALCLVLIASLFSACQNTPKSSDTETEETENTAAATCYELRLGEDITAIELTLDGDKASGYYAWEPHEKDGARGMFSGQKDGDQVTAIFEYMIEGSIQSEEVVFKLEGDKLLQGNGELEDKDGILMLKDKSNLSWDSSFSAVDCAQIQGSIDNAKEVYQMITKEKGN